MLQLQRQIGKTFAAGILESTQKDMYALLRPSLDNCMTIEQCKLMTIKQAFSGACL